MERPELGFFADNRDKKLCGGITIVRCNKTKLESILNLTESSEPMSKGIYGGYLPLLIHNALTYHQ